MEPHAATRQAAGIWNGISQAAQDHRCLAIHLRPLISVRRSSGGSHSVPLSATLLSRFSRTEDR
jgi:hypothetical protein